MTLGEMDVLLISDTTISTQTAVAAPDPISDIRGDGGSEERDSIFSCLYLE